MCNNIYLDTVFKQTNLNKLADESQILRPTNETLNRIILSLDTFIYYSYNV